MSDHERLHALERRVVELEAQNQIARLELEAEQATAKAKLAAMEAMLEAERNVRETIAQAQADYQQALEDAYKSELEQLRAEVELWRRDDRPGLLRLFAARRDAIDRTIAVLGDEASQGEYVERLAAERRELAELEARLGG